MERDSRSSIIIIIIIIIVNIFIKAYQPSQGRSMAATTRGREANIFFNFIGVYSGYDEEDDQKTSGEIHAVFDQKDPTLHKQQQLVYTHGGVFGTEGKKQRWRGGGRRRHRRRMR